MHAANAPTPGTTSASEASMVARSEVRTTAIPGVAARSSARVAEWTFPDP